MTVSTGRSQSVVVVETTPVAAAMPAIVVVVTEMVPAEPAKAKRDDGAAISIAMIIRCRIIGIRRQVDHLTPAMAMVALSLVHLHDSRVRSARHH